MQIQMCSDCLILVQLYCIFGRGKINAWLARGAVARVSVNFRKFSPCIARARRARAGLTVYPPSRTLEPLRLQLSIAQGDKSSENDHIAHLCVCNKKPRYIFPDVTSANQLLKEKKEIKKFSIDLYQYLDQNLLRITNPVSDLTGDQQFYVIFRSCDSGNHHTIF